MNFSQLNLGRYIYTVAIVLPRLSGFLLLPAYATVLSLGDMGLLSTSWIFISLFQTVAGMGMTQALGRLFPMAKDSRHRREILTATLLGTLGGGLLTTLIAILIYAWPMARSHLQFLGQIDVRFFGTILTAGLLGNVTSTLLVYFRAEQKAWSFLHAGIIMAVVEMGLAGMLLAMGKASVVNLLAVECAKQAATFIFIGWKGKRDLNPAFSSKTWKAVTGFGFWLIPVGMCECVFTSSDRFWLGQIVSMESVGIYGFFYKFATPLGVLFIGNLMDFHSYLYKMQGEEGMVYARESLNRFLFRGGLMTLGFAIGFPVAYRLLPLVFPVFPHAYASGLEIFPLLVAALYVFTWGKYYGALLEYRFETREILIGMGITAVFGATLIPLFLKASFSFNSWALSAAAGASLATAFVGLLVMGLLSRKGIAGQYSPKTWLKPLGFILGCLIIWIVLHQTK